MKKLRTLLALGALVLSFTAWAQVPQLLSYQGRVAVGAVNFDGTGQFKFALVNAAGTTTFWSNDGTSTAGSEPAAAIARTVTKGLYAVLLGDIALANMTAIPASVWSNADVRLRVWFNDGTNGFQRLAPDQRLAPHGYLSDGVVTAAKLASGAVDLGGTKITGVLPAANGGAAGANSTLTTLSGLTRAAVAVTAVTANPAGAADTTAFTAPAHGFTAGQLINLVGFNGPGGAGDFSGNYALNSHPPQTTVSAAGLTANTFRIVEGIVSTAQNVGGTDGATDIGVAYAALRDSPVLTISTNSDIYGSEKGVIYLKVGDSRINDLSTGFVMESTDDGNPPNIRRAWAMSTQGYYDVGPAFRVLTGDTLGKGEFILDARYTYTSFYASGAARLTLTANAAAFTVPITTTGVIVGASFQTAGPVNAGGSSFAGVTHIGDIGTGSGVIGLVGRTSGEVLLVADDVSGNGQLKIFATTLDEGEAQDRFRFKAGLASLQVDATGGLSVNGVALGTAVTLTGTALAANVVSSSLTSVGTLTAGATGAGFTVALGASTITGVLAPQNGRTGLGAVPANGQLPIGNGAAYTLATLTGTANNLIVTNGGGSITLASRLTSPQLITITGPAAPVTWTTPAGSFTLARTDAAQTFTGTQTFAGVTTLGSAGTPVKNIRHGRTAALLAGTRTVADPGCTLGTRYFFTVNTLGTVGFPGSYYVSARTVGTSFKVISNRNDDTSILDWMAIEP